MTAFAAVISLVLTLHTYGTNDVDMFRTSAQLAAGARPIELYQHEIVVQQESGGHYVEVFNHPPLVLFLLGKVQLFEHILGLPFHIWFRVLTGLAGVATVLLTTQLIRGRVTSKWNLLLYPLSPAAILVAAYHGNTDPLVILSAVATAWSVEKERSPIITGLLFSLGLNIKLLPLFLIPALILSLRGRRERVLCLGTIGLTSLAIWTPYLAQDFVSVLKSTLGYDSLSGMWGIGYLARYSRYFWMFSLNAKYVILLLSIGLAWSMNRPGMKIPLFDQFGATLFLFLFLTPGFGVQYLYWLTPWAVVLGIADYALHLTASGIFLFAIYDFWARRLPWWYSDAIGLTWPTWLYGLGIMAWLTVGLVLIAYHRKYPAVVPQALAMLLRSAQRS